jgi:hypothetical protein
MTVPQNYVTAVSVYSLSNLLLVIILALNTIQSDLLSTIK